MTEPRWLRARRIMDRWTAEGDVHENLRDLVACIDYEAPKALVAIILASSGPADFAERIKADRQANLEAGRMVRLRREVRKREIRPQFGVGPAPKPPEADAGEGYVKD